MGGGHQGSATREKSGQVGHGRWEFKKGVGGINGGGNHAAMLNISFSIEGLRRETKKKRGKRGHWKVGETESLDPTILMEIN